MIDLSAISSKVWPKVANYDVQRGNFTTKEMELLDFEVLHWYRNLADNFKLDASNVDFTEVSRDQSNFRMRVLLYLRACQVRFQIGRPLFYSTHAIIDNISYANTIVNMAKDTIRLLTTLEHSTPFYRSQQVLFNYFLVSALAALFLAVAHAPAQFGATSRDEFYMALELVRGMTASSFIGRRLWRTIKVLKEVGPMIGMNVRNTASDSSTGAQQHSSGAVTMAHLAGQPLQPYGSQATFSDKSESWEGMTTDLSNMFESAGVMEQSGDDGSGRYVAYQDGLSRMFRDLF